MPGEQLLQDKTQTEAITPLYRIENPNIVARPDGVTSHEELIGQWFTPNISTAMGYLRKSTQTFGKDSVPVDGARLVVASVPTTELDAQHVSNHHIAANMDVENDNYVIPRDGTFPITEVPLDKVVSDLAGNLGNFLKLREAEKRIVRLAGQVAVDSTSYKLS